MFLRRLHDADARVGEHGYEVLQPVRIDHVVRIQDADDLGIGGGAVHRDPERTGLEALHLLGVDELEALAEHAAVILDRLPERRIRRVVDDDDAFEIRIVEPRHRVERLLEHVHRLEIGRDVNRDLGEGEVRPHARGRQRRGLDDQALRRAAERHRRDLLDPRHRDEHEGNEQDHAQGESKGRTEHEIMAVPECEHGRSPRSDAVGGRREQQRLQHGRFRKSQDRQRHQDADEERNGRKLPVIGVLDRAGPGEFWLTRGIQHAPIGADAAFEIFPGLIDRLDDVVFHADGFGAIDEIAQHGGLLERSGIGPAEIVAGAWPAEFRDHDALAGELVAQELIAVHRLIHRLGRRMLLPVGQNVRGDEVGAGCEFRMLAPDAVDFTCRDRNAIDRLLHALDHLDQPVDVVFGNRPLGRFAALVLRLGLCVGQPLGFLTLDARGFGGIELDVGLRPQVLHRNLLAAENGFVADHHADDVAVLAGQIDGGLDLAVVAVAVGIDPGADRHLHAELGGDRRHQLRAFRGGVQAHRTRQRGELSQISADLLGVGDRVGDRVSPLERCVGHARQDAAKVRRLLLFLEDAPKCRMSSGDEQHNSDDGTHREDLTGRSGRRRTCPQGSTDTAAA